MDYTHKRKHTTFMANAKFLLYWFSALVPKISFMADNRYGTRICPECSRLSVGGNPAKNLN